MDKGFIKYTVHAAKPAFDNDKQRQEAYVETFGSPLGTKVLQDILSEAGWFANYYPNPKNPDNSSQALFNNGKREVCITILNKLSMVLQEEQAQEALTQRIVNYRDEPITY